MVGADCNQSMRAEIGFNKYIFVFFSFDILHTYPHIDVLGVQLSFNHDMSCKNNT